jgi:hypothetical protein
MCIVKPGTLWISLWWTPRQVLQFYNTLNVGVFMTEDTLELFLFKVLYIRKFVILNNLEGNIEVLNFPSFIPKLWNEKT